MSFDQNRGPPTSRGSLKSRHDRRRESYDKYEDAGTGHRPSYGHHYGSNLGYQGERGRPRAPQRPSFEDAIAKLDEDLRSALDFCVEINKEFNEDIQGITSYAGSQILNLLWGRKAKYAEDRPDLHGTEAETHGSPHTNFRTIFHTLQASFSIAITSFPSRRPRISGSDGLDEASYNRLYAKLRHANHDIPKLAQTTPTNRSDADALTTELELLGSYLDKCRGLWDVRREENIECQGNDGFSPDNIEDPDRELGETFQ